MIAPPTLALARHSAQPALANPHWAAEQEGAYAAGLILSDTHAVVDEQAASLERMGTP